MASASNLEIKLGAKLPILHHYHIHQKGGGTILPIFALLAWIGPILPIIARVCHFYLLLPKFCPGWLFCQLLVGGVWGEQRAVALDDGSRHYLPSLHRQALAGNLLFSRCQLFLVLPSIPCEPVYISVAVLAHVSLCFYMCAPVRFCVSLCESVHICVLLSFLVSPILIASNRKCLRAISDPRLPKRQISF